MDLDNKPIVLNTRLCRLPFEKSKLLEIIILDQLDDRCLNDAVKKIADEVDLNSSTDFGSLSKQCKLGYILNNDAVTLCNIAELHKEKSQNLFKKMSLLMVTAIATAKATNSFAATVGSVAAFSTTTPTGASSPISSSSTSTATNEKLVTALDSITQSQVQLVAMMRTMNDNMVNTVSANSYAKVPNSDPPSFSNERKNCLSLKRFYENKFQRWLLENKLKDSDAFV